MKSILYRKQKLFFFLSFFLLILCATTWFFFGNINFKREGSSEEKTIHLSIDDAECITDLIINRDTYSSIFDNPFLQYLKELHEKYGIRITLYTFSKFQNRSKSQNIIHVSELPKEFFEEFLSNSDWLKVSFHWESMDFKKEIPANEFEKAFQEVHQTFCHSSDSSVWASAIRLHYFFAPDSLMNHLQDVKTLLCADNEERLSYNLTPHEVKVLSTNQQFSKNGIMYRPTNLRIEDHPFNIRSEIKKNCNQDTLVIFTHEWAINSQPIKDILIKLVKNHTLRINALNRYNFERTIKWLNQNNYNYSFL